MNSFSSDSSSEEVDDNENKEETAQQWVYRHLVEFTNCEDVSAKTLVDGDCSPLIQFLTDMTQSRTLFITISEPVRTEFQPQMVESSIVVPEKTIKTKKVVKKMKRRKKSKKRKQEDEKKKKLKKERKVEPMVNVDPVNLVVEYEADMIFEWWTEAEIPTTDQFLFIIPKTSVPNTEAQLDELYHVGFVKNKKILKMAMKCLEKIFGKKTTFIMRIDLLLLINGIDDEKMAKELQFEKFIIENISQNYNVDGKIRNAEGDTRSITLILSQTIQSFCNNPDSVDPSKLLIQLSFYDIGYLSTFPDIKITAARLEQALDNLSLLQFLYKDEMTEWNRKTYLYLLDLFSTVLAHEITKKSNFMTDYEPGRKAPPICLTFKKVVQKLVSASREIFDSHDDLSATSKVSFSFYIVGILEEEIDSIIAKVEEMNSASRDMCLDRSAIHATKVILKELDVYLQEKCLESAVESGNLESLRSLAATIVKHNKRLERVVALY